MALYPLGIVTGTNGFVEIGTATNKLLLSDIDVQTGNSLTLKLGGAAGSTKLSITDSADVEVAAIDDDGGLTFVSGTSTGDVVVGGNLTVNGDRTIIGTDLQTADDFVLFNDSYTTDAAINSGFMFVIDPDSTAITVASGGFTDTGTNDTVAVDVASGLAAGDIILVENPADPDNAGLFEVLTHAGSVITIKTTGGTAPTANLGLGTGFVTDATVQGNIRKVSCQFIRVKTTGGLEVAFGDNAPTLSFSDLATAAGSTLQTAYDAGASIALDASGPVIFSDNGVTGDKAIQLQDELKLLFGTGEDVDINFDNAAQIFSINMSGTATMDMNLIDNSPAAWQVQQGTDTYISISTVDAIESISFGSGTLNQDFSFNGTTSQATFQGNIDAENGLDVTTAPLTSAAGTTHSGGELLVSGGNAQINDDIVLTFGTNDDASIEYDEDGSDNIVLLSKTAASGIAIGKEYTASGTGVTANDVVTMSTAGEIDSADADTEATSYVLGVALDTATSATTRVVHSGVVACTFDSPPGASDNGKPVYLHTTAGQVSLTRPTGSGDTIIRVGFLVDHTNTLVNLSIGDPVSLA